MSFKDNVWILMGGDRKAGMEIRVSRKNTVHGERSM